MVTFFLFLLITLTVVGSAALVGLAAASLVMGALLLICKLKLDLLVFMLSIPLRPCSGRGRTRQSSPEEMLNFEGF